MTSYKSKYVKVDFIEEPCNVSNTTESMAVTEFNSKGIIMDDKTVFLCNFLCVILNIFLTHFKSENRFDYRILENKMFYFSTLVFFVHLYLWNVLFRYRYKNFYFTVIFEATSIISLMIILALISTNTLKIIFY